MSIVSTLSDHKPHHPHCKLAEPSAHAQLIQPNFYLHNFMKGCTYKTVHYLLSLQAIHCAISDNK